MPKLLDLFQQVKPVEADDVLDQKTLEYFLDEIEKAIGPDKRVEAGKAAESRDFDLLESIIVDAEKTPVATAPLEEKMIPVAVEKKSEEKIHIDTSKILESFNKLAPKFNSMSEDQLNSVMAVFTQFIYDNLGDEAEVEAKEAVFVKGGITTLRRLIAKAEREKARKAKKVNEILELIRVHLGEAAKKEAEDAIKSRDVKRFREIYSKAKLEDDKITHTQEAIVESFLSDDEYKDFKRLSKLKDENKEASNEYISLIRKSVKSLAEAKERMGVKEEPKREKKRDYIPIPKEKKVEVVDTTKPKRMKRRLTKKRLKRIKKPGRKLKPMAESIKEYVEAWFNRMEMEALESKRDKFQTIRGYRHALNTFSEWLGSRDFRTLKPSDGTMYVDWMLIKPRSYKSRTIQVKISAAASFYDFLTARDIVPTNPFASIKAPAAEALKPKPITPDMDKVLFGLEKTLKDSYKPSDLLLTLSTLNELWNNHYLGFVPFERYLEYIKALSRLRKLRVPSERKAELRKAIGEYYDMCKVVIPFDEPFWQSMIVMRFAGLRISEVFNLSNADIKKGPESGMTIVYVKKGKGSKSRSSLFVPYYDKDGNPDNTYMKKFELYFTNRSKGKKPLWDRSKDSLRSYVARLKKAEIFDKSFNFHRLRHTFATMLINNGHSYDMVAELLGHESTKTTRVYGKISSVELERRFVGEVTEIAKTRGLVLRRVDI